MSRDGDPVAASPSGSRRVDVIAEQLNNDLRAITASRNAAENAKRAPKARWTNHAQLGFCNPAVHHTPRNVEELQHIIKSIAAKKETCRIAGDGKSPSSIAFTNGHMIHTEELSRVCAVDPNAMTITCEGGALLRDIHRVLDANGLMLRCVPSIVDMTIAGAMATAAHSSGIGTKSICAYVSNIILVNGLGELVEFSREKTPKELRTVACHLGAMGVVVRVTLQAERRSTWRMVSDRCTVQRIHRVLAQRVMTSEYYRFWWTPHTDECYETMGRRLTAADEEARGAGSQNGAATTSVYSTISASTTKSNNSDGKMKRVLSLLRKETTDATDQQRWEHQQKSLSNQIMRAVKGLWLRHHTLEAALLVGCYVPRTIPFINQVYQKIFLSRPQEFFGSAVDAFTFDCLFRQWACEWAIEAHLALDAFDLVRQLIQRSGAKVHFPVEFRFCDAEDIALSPSVGRKTCWVGLVMYRPHGTDARDTQRIYRLFCQLMQSLGGRPHWAKHFEWRRNDVATAYGSQWERWLELRQQLDPQRMFVNEWLHALLTQD